MKNQLNLIEANNERQAMVSKSQLPTQLGLLLVDDEEFNLKALKRTLYDQGFTIYTALNGQQALEILETTEIAIVVSDMRMQGMTGVELLTKVLKRWPDTQRIILTGYSDINDAIDAVNNSNIYRYITKPWDDEYLLSTLHEAAAVCWGKIMDQYFEETEIEKNVELKSSNLHLIHSYEQSQNQLKKLNEKLRHSYEEEKLLREQRREAQRLSEAKSRFLATISHEIRTPLNSIIATNSLLLESKLSNEQMELAQLSLNGANTLLTLINDILDFSKINAGRLELQETWFELLEVVESTCELLSGNLVDKNVDIAVVVSPDTPTEIYGDKTRITQILTNLLSNAIKFTDEGCIVLHIAYHGELTIKVSDTGIGIAEDKLGGIFEEFSQVDNSSTQTKGGTGLGLSICKTLTQLMGGSIHVNSTLKEGTVFSVHLPLSVSNPIAFPKFSEIEKKMVLLSHNYPLYKALQAQLAYFGCHLFLENSLNISELKEYDAVIYDMDSLCFVNRIGVIKECTKPVLHVALISNDGIDKTTRLQKSGFEIVLRKPVRLSSLMRHFIYRFSEKPDESHLNKEQKQWVKSCLNENKSLVNRPEVIKLRGVKILLAEDSPSNQAVIKSILKNMDVEVDIANNGSEAVDKATAYHYDLILMDVRMPIKDGLTASREITYNKGLNTKTPIVALTANAYSEDQKACSDAGMVDFISKPVDVVRFRQCVVSWCRGNPKKHGSTETKELSNSNQQCYIDMLIIKQLEKDTSVEVLPKILSIFMDETEKRLLSMHQYYDQKNWDALESDAHTLKSSAGSFGALPLHDLAKEIESGIIAKKFEEVDELMLKLSDICEKSINALKDICNV